MNRDELIDRLLKWAAEEYESLDDTFAQWHCWDEIAVDLVDQGGIDLGDGLRLAVVEQSGVVCAWAVGEPEELYRIVSAVGSVAQQPSNLSPNADSDGMSPNNDTGNER